MFVWLNQFYYQTDLHYKFLFEFLIIIFFIFLFAMSLTLKVSKNPSDELSVTNKVFLNPNEWNANQDK